MGSATPRPVFTENDKLVEFYFAKNRILEQEVANLKNQIGSSDLVKRIQVLDSIIHEYEAALLHAGVKHETLTKVRNQAIKKAGF